jgi:hypothetical protein
VIRHMSRAASSKRGRYRSRCSHRSTAAVVSSCQLNGGIDRQLRNATLPPPLAHRDLVDQREAAPFTGKGRRVVRRCQSWCRDKCAHGSAGSRPNISGRPASPPFS